MYVFKLCIYLCCICFVHRFRNSDSSFKCRRYVCIYIIILLLCITICTYVCIITLFYTTQLRCCSKCNLGMYVHSIRQWLSRYYSIGRAEWYINYASIPVKPYIKGKNWEYMVVKPQQIPYSGKAWRGESLANLANKKAFPKLKPSKLFHSSVHFIIISHATLLQAFAKLFSPTTFDKVICQTLSPPNIPAIQYKSLT